MGIEATLELRDQVNGQSGEPAAVNEYQTMNLAKLETVDVNSLTPEQQVQYSKVVAAHLFGAKNAGILVLKTGAVFVGGRAIGTVSQAHKVGKIVPGAFKFDQKYADADGNVTLPTGKVKDGFEAIDQITIAAARVQLARVKGNGIHLIGQKGKSDDAVANALAPLKGAWA